MRTAITLTLTLAAIAVSSCGSEPEEQANALSEEQIAAEVGKLPLPQAGLYKRTTSVLELTVPGASDEDMARMKTEAEKENDVREECLTEEDAANGYKDMVRALGEAQDGLTCDFSEFASDGSRIDAKLLCDAPLGASAKIAIAGTIEPDSTDLELDMGIDVAIVGEMTMKLAMQSERIGACP